MFRKTITIFSLIGLSLSLAFWGVSYFNVEILPTNGEGRVFLGKGCLIIGQWGYSRPGDRVRGWRWHGFENSKTTWLPSWRLRPFYGSYGTIIWVVHIPLWIPTVLFGFALWLSRLSVRRARARREGGQCVNCGYDLRGSAGRCPECGMELGTNT